jgi:dolichol-phosphate mannosyltransferase/undecaprenyl-phosphate 4-deoxy-4-formamido-L-arabinose transferase
MATPDYSVVIPVYNSSVSLRNLAARLETMFAAQKNSYELILVDDASPNSQTWPTIEALCAANLHIRALQHAENYGQHHAFRTGMRQARGQYVITMDDDGEHRPEDIPLLMAAREHDIVMARTDRRKRWFERTCSRIKMLIENFLFGKKIHVYVTSFCVFSQSINQAMLQLEAPYPVLSAMQLYVTRDIVNVPTPAGERLDAVSNYTFWKKVKLFAALLYSAFLLRRSTGPQPFMPLRRSINIHDA